MSTRVALGRSVWLVVLGASIIVASSACNTVVDKGLAEDAVKTFHDQFNSDSFHDIYAAATDEFKSATREADWIDLLTAVKRKAGVLVSTKQTQWQVNEATYGSAVNLVYDSTFTSVGATEHFSYAIRSGKAVLVGYRIDAPTPLTK